FDKHRPFPGHHHLGVRCSVADLQCIQHGHCVVAEPAGHGVFGRHRVFVIVDGPAASDVSLVIAPYLNDVVDAVAADGVDEVFVPGQVLLCEHRLVPAAVPVDAGHDARVCSVDLFDRLTKEDVVRTGAGDGLEDHRPLTLAA